MFEFSMVMDILYFKCTVVPGVVKISFSRIAFGIVSSNKQSLSMVSYKEKQMPPRI